MNIPDKDKLALMRRVLRRPYGAYTTFIPTGSQASIIRMTLLKYFDAEERGESVWINIGEKVWAAKDKKNTWAPILTRHRQGHWLFLTHNLFSDSKSAITRARSDIYVVHQPTAYAYVDVEGEVIHEADYLFDDIGELIGGKWKFIPREVNNCV